MDLVGITAVWFLERVIALSFVFLAAPLIVPDAGVDRSWDICNLIKNAIRWDLLIIIQHTNWCLILPMTTTAAMVLVMIISSVTSGHHQQVCLFSTMNALCCYNYIIIHHVWGSRVRSRVTKWQSSKTIMSDWLLSERTILLSLRLWYASSIRRYDYHVSGRC